MGNYPPSKSQENTGESASWKEMYEEEKRKRLEEERKRLEEESKRIVAEKEKTEEKSMRLEEERKRLEEESKRIAAERGKTEAEKKTFLVSLNAMGASSSSESNSQIDVERLGVPEATCRNRDFFCDVLVKESEVLEAWSEFQRMLEAKKLNFDHFTERKIVQPVIELALNAASAAAVDPQYKVWRESKPEDEINGSNIQPDFSLTHKDDATLSLLHSLFFVEVKLPGGNYLESAVKQAAAYCRRVLRVLVNEALERGEESELDKLSAMAAGTDGNSIVLVQVRSGAPSPGQNWRDCTPCPSEKSRVYNLFPNWNFRSAKPTFPEKPPEGFCLLVKLFRASKEQLGVTTRQLLRQVSLFEKITNEVFDFVLGDRLGSGGSSDVYEIVQSSRRAGGGAELRIEGGEAAAAVGEGGGGRRGGQKEEECNESVMKIARFASKSISRCFNTEASVLESLASSSCLHVPKLVFNGTCLSFSSSSSSSSSPSISHPPHIDRSTKHAHWQAICISPKGISLSSWIAQQIEESSQRIRLRAQKPIVERSTRIECANLMLSHLLLALHCAHKQGIVHCDLRPQNIIVASENDFAAAAAAETSSMTAAAAAVASAAVGDDDRSSSRTFRFVLVDWGLACRIGEKCSGRGVAAYAAEATTEDSNTTASARLDLEAIIYTWLSVVYGGEHTSIRACCEAPWIKTAKGGEEMLNSRNAWLGEKILSSDKYVERARDAVNFLKSSRSEDATASDELYVNGADHFWHELGIV